VKAFPRDIEVATMKERHIGIENELAVGPYNRGDLPYKADILLSKRGLLNSIGHDGGGREFRTNPISIKSLKQVRGYKYLSEYYDILKKHTKVIGTGGTHIHISILDKDHENMESNATAIGIAFYKQFQKISGRKTSWAYRLGCNSIESVRSELRSNRYTHLEYANRRVYGRMSSMLNPTGHQTLEFRGPKGSNTKEEVLAWVEFLENIVKVSNRRSVEGVQFKKLLEGPHISAYVKKLPITRRLTKNDLEHTFNGSALTAK
jgi:hypothetical protein